MEAIVAVDEKFGISKNGAIPWKNKEDMKFFKSKTIGNIVVMGSNTLLSLPKSNPLGGRFNIVLTNNKEKYIEKYLNFDNIVFYNYDEFMDYFENVETDKTIYVIGGKQIYDLLSPYCGSVWMSTIRGDYDCDLKFDANMLQEGLLPVYGDEELTIVVRFAKSLTTSKRSIEEHSTEEILATVEKSSIETMSVENCFIFVAIYLVCVFIYDLSVFIYKI